jgi:hypothetical protein
MIVSPDRIESLPTADLVPYARNARTHSDAQVEQIVASIQEFGFTNPVLIGADNGIIAGHGRVLAALRMGLERVPCVRLGHLSDAQRRAYVLADNQLALNAGWDEDLMASELQWLDTEGADISLIGIDAETLAQYLEDITIIGDDLIDGDGRRTNNNMQMIGKGNNVGLQFGAHMMTLPRDVYDRVSDYLSAQGGDKRDGMLEILNRGLTR